MSGEEKSTAPDEGLSRIELQIEQEKLKLERERILLEQERLAAMRDRMQSAAGNGGQRITLSTLTLVSIICTLVGGILGAFSTSLHLDRRNTVRMQEVMQTLAATSPEALTITAVEDGTNTVSEMPEWLKNRKPTGKFSGIKLLVIQ